MKIRQPYKDKFVNALRSGQYKQGQKWLYRTKPYTQEETWCAMGVLCTVHPESKFAKQNGIIDEDGMCCFHFVPQYIFDEVVIVGNEKQRKTDFVFDDTQTKKLIEMVNPHSPNKATLMRTAYENNNPITMTDANDLGVGFYLLADFVEQHC